MNRILKRPMFRMGGSSGTGITSGLDQPRKQYANGTQMPNFQASGLPGFLTSFGLNLLATPPQGNIFQTAATAARDPFNQLQASQAALMKTASDRAFAEKLAKEEREFEEGQLEKRLDVERAKIDKMGGGDLQKRIEAEKPNFGGNDIKAARAIDFYDNKFTELQGSYGDEGVFIDPVDLSIYENQKNGLEKFVKQNPQAKRQVVYDVTTGKAVRIVMDVATGKLKAIPADSADIDTTGESMPPPVRNPGYLRPPKQVDLDEPDFGIGFYD